MRDRIVKEQILCAPIAHQVFHTKSKLKFYGDSKNKEPSGLKNKNDLHIGKLLYFLNIKEPVGSA